MQILCRCIELTDSIAQKTIRKKQSRQSHITSQAVGMEIFAAFPHHAQRRQFNLIPTIIRRNLQKRVSISISLKVAPIRQLL
jgi:hypothetical protein